MNRIVPPSRISAALPKACLAAGNFLRTAFCLFVSGSGILALFVVALVPAPLGAASLVGNIRARTGAPAAENPSGGTGGQAVDSATATALAQAQRQSLVRTTQAILAVRQAQAAARAAALAGLSEVPNGLTPGGLVVADGATPGSDLWQGADGPTQTHANGATVVDIKQQAQKAILTWEQFNVGRETTVNFDQQGNRDWVALNRVNDPSARPSQIQGQIKADGSVYILNRNGIIFGGASQVNVGNLVAAAASMTDTQFLNNGIYSPQSGANYTPSFTDAGGLVKVEAGAQITTHAPQSVTSGGGYVLLLGTGVTNEGTIITPKGQAALAAGDDFSVRRGYGTEENQYSTTRGNEVSSLIDNGSDAGTVINRGLIEASEGDITLAGRTVIQDGVALATTSVNQRGTIHLLNAASDASGSVTLTGNSLTAILPELDSDATALDSQRDALIAASDEANLLRGGGIADRLDQSRIEITTGGDVLFEGGSLTMAQGGQVAVQATAGRITVEDGATIDVSGVRGVALDMASNTIRVNIQGNELRDSPLNREEDWLKNQDVWIDLRDLIYVPAGTGGYESDRWYTAGGLLEVGGYLANTAHTIGEWASVGGTITLAANEVVAHQGAVFDLSGGSLDYAAGATTVTRVLGSDGKLYDLSSAPADLTFFALGNAHVEKSAKWGVTKVWSNPLTNQAHVTREEEGYTVGRDAGTLILTTPTAVFDGTILAGVVNGSRQIHARPGGVTDGYKLGQTQAALAGRLTLSGYQTSLINNVITTIVVPVASAVTFSNDPRPDDPTGTSWFNADALNSFGLGGLHVATSRTIAVEDDLVLARGADVSLAAAESVTVDASIVARSGNVTLGGSGLPVVDGGIATQTITLRPGAGIDTRGLWTNALLDPSDLSGLAYVDGGNVILRASGNVVLETGSKIDASAGGVLLVTGDTVGGAGGDISLLASYAPLGGVSADAAGMLQLDGTLSSYGVTRGGKLTLRSGGIVVIGDEGYDLGTTMEAGETLPVDVILTEDVVWPAGTPLPASATLLVEKIVPEGVLTDDVQLVLPPGNPLTLTTDLIIQPDGVTGTFGSYFYTSPTGQSTSLNTRTGGIIPKGSRLSGVATFFAGLVTVGSEGFNLGIVSTVFSAGSAAPQDVTFQAGQRLVQNSVLPTSISFKPLSYVHLAADALTGGFSGYDVHGISGLVIADNVALKPTMPAYRLGAASFSAPTGTDPSSALELWTPPAYLENPETAALTQRGGVDLSFSSGYEASDASGNASVLRGWVYVGEGASIEVDPGHNVTLTSGGQLTVKGRIVAPGGQINLLGSTLVDTNSQGSSQDFADFGTTSIWVGSRAVLDVSARAYTAFDAQGRVYGTVPDGGSITLGSYEGLNAQTQVADAARAFIIVRPGAVLSADGTSAAINLTPDLLGNGLGGPGSSSTTVASNGGEIAMRSYTGIYNDGLLSARSGGASAAGGTLSLVLELPSLAGKPAPRVLTISQDHAQDVLPDALFAGMGDTNLKAGSARISTSQIENGGFDNVSLWGRSAILFDGDVSLNVGQSLALLKGAIYNSSETGRVNIEAPYILFAGQTSINPPDTIIGTPGQAIYAAASTSGMAFNAAADLIDVRDAVGLAFVDSTLTSRGDIRFLKSSDKPRQAQAQPTLLGAASNLNLIAQQLYPDSGAEVRVVAGALPSSNNLGRPPFASDSVLTIGSIDGVDPGVPYSLFGTIELSAATVRQGGIVHAPFGSIMLGSSYGDLSGSDTVLTELLPGSITSVSAKGLIMPYGGTTDGVIYTVDGDDAVTPNLFTGELAIGTASGQTGVYLNGVNIRSDAGSLLDLSGGGELTGAGFVSGRGGSIDVLLHPLIDANPANSYSASGNQIFAIVPGARTAPVGASYYDAWTGDLPEVGRQITIPAGVPGLPAGTYTLMPASYALMPGAFRIEIGGQSPAAIDGAKTLPNGSYLMSGVQSIAHTTIKDSISSQIIVTPGTPLRTYGQYNEQGYDAFQRAQAATFGTMRALLPNDGKFLTININPLAPGSEPTDEAALDFNGHTDMTAAEGGFGGYLVLAGGGTLAITGPDSDTRRSESVTTISADAINSIGAPNIYIGKTPRGSVADALTRKFTGVDFFPIQYNNTKSPTAIRLESGAVLNGSQIILVAAGSIVLESDSSINTLGSGVSAPGLEFGYLVDPTDNAVLAVTNGEIGFRSTLPGGATITVEDGASIYSKGTVNLVASGGATFGQTDVRIGARNLSLELPWINIGELDGVNVPGGLNIDQDLLDRLLDGDPSVGSPAVERLVLAASNSINFYGSAELDARGGQSGTTLVLSSPAIYGYGSNTDTVHILADTLIWSGKTSAETVLGQPLETAATPGAIIPDGPGTGQGTFTIDANRIVFGYPDQSQPTGTVTVDRLMLGFSQVNFNASDRITANHLGTLSVYQAGDDPSAGFDAATYAGTGGNLNFSTPLLTTEAGASIAYRAGGAVSIAAPEGANPSVVASKDLGGEISIGGDSITVATAIVLPSGKLALTASNDILLTDSSRLDLAGHAIQFFDVTKYSWGGDVELESTHGNIVQQTSSVIDLSAANEDAGTLKLTATDADAGQVLMSGMLLGKGGDGHIGGVFDVRAQRIGEDAADLTADFAALNGRLNDAGFFGGRSFVLKQGDLTIGDELRGHEINVSVDSGSMTVNGRIDASNTAPGTIRLAARDDLTLAGSAVLDASGSVLQVDSYGQPIEAKNRSQIELTSRNGWLRINRNATLDVSAPDHAGGRVELNVGRTGETSGDARIDAADAITIRGADSIALNAFWSYSPTDAAGTIVQDNGASAPVDAAGRIGLDQIDIRNAQFVDAALLSNSVLRGRIAGLSAYEDAFHLRPGVEINSADTPNGDLTVDGDLDLSGYRYDSLNPDFAKTAVYGSGEPLALILRASADLIINGTISDGFEGTPGIPAGYTGLIPDVTTSSLFFRTTDAWQSAYVTSDSLILVDNWRVPETPFYYDSNHAIYDASTFGTYAPGTLIPAGTRLYANSGWLRLEPDADPLPVLATGLAPAQPGEPASSLVAIPMGTGSQSASIRLVSGADLGSADARTLQPRSAQLYNPGGTTFGAAINLGNNSGVTVFSNVDFGWGYPTDAYLGSSGSYYFAEDWVVPNSPFYAAFQSPGYFTDSSGTQYAPGSMVKKGTAINFSASTWVFDASTALPDLTDTVTTVQPGYSGSILLDNAHQVNGRTVPSLIRTGTGNLELLAASDLVQNSLFGVYTAGAQVVAPPGYAPSANSYFADHGGDLLIATQGDLRGTNQAAAVSDWLVSSLAPDGTGIWSIRFGDTVARAFSGLGALGGGNVTILAGGDADRIVAAVASSGFVTNDTLSQTGGGDLTVRIGGRLNQAVFQDTSGSDQGNGVFVNVRGDMRIDAGAIGTVPLTYSGSGIYNDPRGSDPFAPTNVLTAWGGPILVPGDGNSVLRTRGDLALGGVGTPVTTFSLWRNDTAIRLFSAGGNLVPYNGNNPTSNEVWIQSSGENSYYLLPPILSAVAASGGIFSSSVNPYSFELVSSPQGQLEFLAQDSIYGIGDRLMTHGRWNVSGRTTDPATVSSPFKPGALLDRNSDFVTTLEHEGDLDPIRLYAVNGDITNFALGEQRADLQDNARTIAAKAAQIRAGRDIVNFGNFRSLSGTQALMPSVIMNVNDTDVSVISAGRDMFYTNVLMAGPGTLEVSAGRNIYQGDNGSVTSVGPVAVGDTRAGASIAMEAGIANDVAWDAVRDLYLAPTNLADPDFPLAHPNNEGKVAHTYDAELVDWLESRYGFTGDGAEAQAFFETLAPEQQNIFLRQVYFAELRAGGREYNNPESSRFGSYLRGRQMIATLFPEEDAEGNPIERSGNITMFGGSGVRTQFGGGIQMLAPGGQIIVGVEGLVPPSTAGVVTQGAGDIQMYSQGSILLGLSRIMTTFGGDIFGWSAEGDINAGRGAKTTIVFTPARRVYDNYGNVTLAPTVPGSGAGIATLNPIPEVPPGDVDLIAPLGTIDVGEAGIRVSGNINLAALQIINAANIQVQGNSAGIPVAAMPNLGAITAATNTANAATAGAMEAAAEARRSPVAAPVIPSVFRVQVIGYGGLENEEPEKNTTQTAPASAGVPLARLDR
ncbi:filamentous hemagglutinin family N-terminal domain protein [Opitutaceae bacterium TAV1]|nr:filamentous hemagglutinin family N-terminal domain protein [Opitutaceae bacterium TAV1]